MIFDRFRRRRSADDELDGLYPEASPEREDPRDPYADDAYDDHESIRIGDEDFEVEQAGPKWRSYLGCLLPITLVALIAGGGYYGYQKVMDHFGADTCKVRDAKFDYQWSPEQTANAATIGVIGTHKLQLPSRASQIAQATAIQESKLRNLRSGDRDSVGLFQQRPSQGWGTVDQLTDPVYASTAFYKALTKIDGWQQMDVTVIAQKVQRSGYPEAYADHETQGRVLATAFSGQYHEGIGCRLPSPDGTADVQGVVEKLREQAGANASVSNGAIRYQGRSADDAWAIASWAVAQAKYTGATSVIVGDRAWNRSEDKASWGWTDAKHPSGGDTVVRIEF